MLAVILVIVGVAILVAIAVHFGPHGSIVSGIVGLVAGLIAAWALHQGNESGVGWGILAGGVVVGGTLGVLGVRGLRGLNAKAELASPPQLVRLLGERGIVQRDVAPVGAVKVRGEVWTACSEDGEPIREGHEVFVTRVDGLRLWVIPADVESSHRAGDERPKKEN